METDSSSPASPAPSSRDPAWPLWFAQTVVTAFFLLPLITGGETLFFRDVGNFHWPAKLEQARIWSGGETPHLDLWRGGQPGLGNPNTTPFYPTNVLLRSDRFEDETVAGGVDGGAASVLWGFNAHFWLHLLLAPVLVAGWLRCLGFRGPAPWVGAAAFGGSGFVVSTLGFHNLVAYTAAIPALLWSVAASVSAASPVRAAFATASLSFWWAMLLLAGDPTSAAIGLAAAAVSVVFLERKRWAHAGWPLLAVGCGTLIAWPQIAALLGTLEGSMRGALGYSAEGVLRGSWHPMLSLDLLFPFALGLPDGSFWGARFHGGAQPLIFSFFPGVAVLVLCAVGAFSNSRPRLRWLGCVLVGMGVAVGLGGFNPLVKWLAQVGGLSWLRFPVKAWWLVVLGTTLLAALAVQRPASERARESIEHDDSPRAWPRTSLLERLSRLIGWLWLFVGLSLAGLSLRHPGWLETWVDHPAAPTIVEANLWRHGWVAVLGGFTLLCLTWTLRRPGPWRWSAWIALFVAVQLAALQPLFPMLGRSEVLQRPAVYADLQQGASVIHGPLDLGWPTAGFAGRGGGPAPMENGVESAADQQRRLNALGVPMVGVVAGARFPFNSSPDGLDSYLPGAVRRLLRRAPRGDQLRLLPRLGVTHIVAPAQAKPASEEAPEGASRGAWSPPAGMALVDLGRTGGPTFSSRWVRSSGIADTLARLSADIAAEMSGSASDSAERLEELVVVADDLNELLQAAFGARSEVVVSQPSERQPSERDSHSAGSMFRVVTDRVDGSTLEVNAVSDGWLVLPRAWLPRYRAWVDDVAVRTSIGNGLRLAVPVPAGLHRVEVRYDTRSWDQRWRYVGSGLAALLLLVLLRIRRAARTVD